MLDQLIGLLIAGHERIGAAMGWVLERLVRSPAALERVPGELEAGEERRYLEAVALETLRLRPPIVDAMRLLRAPLEIAGHRLPAGTVVMVAIPLVHGSPGRPENEEFRPERFLDERPEPRRWIPFGGGARRCLGASLAMVEMLAVVPASSSAWRSSPSSLARSRSRCGGRRSFRGTGRWSLRAGAADGGTCVEEDRRERRTPHQRAARARRAERRQREAEREERGECPGGRGRRHGRAGHA